MNQKPDMSGLLASLPPFQHLSAERIAQVAQRTRERKLERGETLFHKGDAASSLFVVVYGQVKLALPASNGNEKVVELVGPKQSFGDASMLADCPYPVFAEAVSETLLLQVAKEVIIETLEDDGAFARRMLANLAKRTHLLIQDVEIYTQQKCAQRVVSFLQHHCSGVMGDDDSIAITLPASKQLIASRLNLTPETLSRIFHDLIEAKLIAVQGRQVTINSLKLLQEFDC